MNSRVAAAIVVVCGVMSSMYAFGHMSGANASPTRSASARARSLKEGRSHQEKPPYDDLMRDISATFASLRKNLDANAAAVVLSDSAKLERLFGDVEAFWAAYKTKDAIEAAKGAREAVIAVAAAAKGNDMKKAQAAYAGIGKYCTGCHNAHREQMPDKTYKIRP